MTSRAINRFTLDNGLRVIHQQDSAAAMVALNVLYNTGARDENPELTGMAHLMEHLMFAGSANVTNFDGELQRAGGTSNAWTSNDFTNFYIIVPAVNAEIAFRLESDRMLAPNFSQMKLENQQSVVIEEFKQQCLNRPYGDLYHHLRALTYRVHPYRWPVIGLTPDHIRSVTLQDVTDYFAWHYSLSNAVLAVTGNISLERCRDLCNKWLNDIPSRPVKTRDYAAEPPVTTPRHATVTGHVPYTSLVMAYHMDPRGTKGYYAADAITDILSNGPSSRFEQLLRKHSDMFIDLDASILGSEEPGLIIINARLQRDDVKSINDATYLLSSQLEELTANGVTSKELQRVKNKYESNAKFNDVHYLKRAATLAMSEMHNESPGTDVVEYTSLSTTDIVATAQSIFNPSGLSTLIYKRIK